ncbi:MAG TPA: DUF2334 domain-containing protein [Candidatus Binatia bacterium]|nr:DUF2334 domain-containing protein [Candidatus Binatia bacterium]
MNEAAGKISHGVFRAALILGAIVAMLALQRSQGQATAPDPLAIASERAPAHAILVRPSSTPIFAPPSLDRLLVVIDHTNDPKFEQNLGDGAATALHHFARNVRWLYVDDLTAADVRDAEAVVYLGLRAAKAPRGWTQLRFARRLVVFNQHLAQLQSLGMFPHAAEVGDIATPPHAEITYGGERFAVGSRVYTRFEVRAGARALGTIHGEGTSAFAVLDGGAAFIAAPLGFGSEFRDPYRQGFLLAACDALRIALGAPAEPRVALLRFEDVSVEVPTPRMRAIVEYMAASNLPYGIGVIPNQLIKGVDLRTLGQDPELVETLRFAEAHGARIVLHGFHHSFNSPEDFEFWDAEHNRPLPEDSVAWMSRRLNAGLTIERSLGLHPVMWESPHYSASPLDYRVVASFFATSWERRRPVAFLPWPIDRDQYGSALLPENLGYIAVDRDDRTYTLQMQLARARAFTVCADCVPAAFLHPSTVELADIIDFVNGVEALGYRFVDPLALVEPRDGA